MRNPLIGFPYRNRVVKAHRTSDGLTIIRGAERIFLERGDPKFVRIIGYLGIKEGESAWLRPDALPHVMEILGVTTCDKEKE